VLLLQLQRGASHGYGLLEGLEEFDLGLFDPSVIYRLLRDMESSGWVSSTWDDQQTQGPPRRVYSLSAEGEGVLQGWVKDLEEGRTRIDRFLHAYKHLNK
jgi:DNA-binding PadR family transcriptional regulator